MKTLLFLFATCFVATSFGQNFEGKIVYKNAIKSKLPNVTDEQFTSMLGSRQDYFIKDGNYKSVTNGSFVQWQLYNNINNKLYSKMSNAEAVLWNDAAINNDEVLKSEMHNNVTGILGYICDELILTCKSGVQKYYFNSKLSVDPKLFVNHKYGNWYEYIVISKSLPLKAIIENAQFILESIATEITPLKLDKSLFELQENTTIIKSTY